MKLLTKELEKKLPTYEQLGDMPIEEQVAVCKFFNPTGAGTWYVTAYDPEAKIFTGWVSIFGDWNDEYGDFSLAELESFVGKFGLGIERDLNWEPKKLCEIMKKDS